MTVEPSSRMIDPSPNCFLMTRMASAMACVFRSDLSLDMALSFTGVEDAIARRVPPTSARSLARAVRVPAAVRNSDGSVREPAGSARRDVEQAQQLLLLRGGVVIAELGQGGGVVAVEQEIRQ